MGPDQVGTSLQRQVRGTGQYCATAGTMSTGDAAWSLSHFPLFQSLDPGDLKELARASCTHRYGKGERVEYRTTSEPAVLAVARGEMQLYRVSCTGNKATIRTCRTGDIFGFSSAVVAVASRSLLEAIEDGTVIYHVPGHLFRHAIASQPEIALAAIDLLGQQLAAMCDQVEDLALHGVRTRLAHVLARRARVTGGIVLETHDELAAEIGTRRDEVTKMLRRFREDGLVMTLPHRTGIVVVDLEKLAGDE